MKHLEKGFSILLVCAAVCAFGVAAAALAIRGGTAAHRLIAIGGVAQLDYLADRSLVELKKEPSGRWFADVTRYGVDIAEYTVDCQPGIARPVKYWA